MKAHRVELGALVQRLRSSNATLALGPVALDGRTYAARAVGALKSLEEIRNLAVNDQGLRLGDIADLRYEEPPVDFGRHLNREQAIALDVFKESTANTVQTVEAVQHMITAEIARDPLLTLREAGREGWWPVSIGTSLTPRVGDLASVGRTGYG